MTTEIRVQTGKALVNMLVQDWDQKLGVWSEPATVPLEPGGVYTHYVTDTRRVMFEEHVDKRDDAQGIGYPEKSDAAHTTRKVK